MSGNPDGRKPKLVSHIIAELKKQGYENVGPSHIRDAYELIMNLSEEKIVDLVANKEAPMLMRIVARRIMDKKDGHEMIEKILDRAHGKAKQSIDHSTLGEKIVPALDLSIYTYDQLKQLAKGDPDPDPTDDPQGSKS